MERLLSKLYLTSFNRISKNCSFLFLTVCVLCIGLRGISQTAILEPKQYQFLNLDQCIQYALINQPAIKGAQINENITGLNNSIALSGLLPQVNLTGTGTHYLQLPTAFSTNSTGVTSKIKSGINNTFIPILGVTQNLYNPELKFASKAAKLYVDAAKQITDSTKINIISSVSKSFYSLLLTLQQIDVLKEDTVRLAKNVKDSYHQYVGGIVDVTDYQTATITLNNSKALLRQANESVVPQYAVLKQLIGFAPETQFNVSFDTSKMMQEIDFDTTQTLQYENRIEYQQLKNVRKIQQALTGYYQKAYLPTVDAFFNYIPEFENKNFGSLFNNVYPYSYLGVSITMPIFSGFARIKNVQKSKLQEKLIDWNEVNLKSQIYSEYTNALASYKSNLYELNIMSDNEELAKKVYKVVTLQYSQGIVPYLNVVNAESNLITSEIGYLNTLLQVLSSKIDLQKAMGIVNYNR